MTKTHYHTIARLVSLILIVLTTSVCKAQDNLRFTNLSTNQGLSQADVTCFLQDSLGFLWIGTSDGLNRYDGDIFAQYTKDKSNSHSLQFNVINHLVMDSASNIWIASNGGIAIYEYALNSFENFFMQNEMLQDAKVNHIQLLNSNEALLSTDKGLVCFNRAKKIFTVKEDHQQLRGIEITCTVLFGGKQWYATMSGLMSQQNKNEVWDRYLENTRINHLLVDGQNLLLSTDRGLFVMNVASSDIKEIQLPKEMRPVYFATKLRSGSIWVAAAKVAVLDSNFHVTKIIQHSDADEYSISSNGTRTIFETTDGVVWTGNKGFGVNKYNPDVAAFHYLAEGSTLPLSDDYVSCVFTPDDNIIYVGLLEGFDVFDLRKQTKVHQGSDLLKVSKIDIDKKGRIWMGGDEFLASYANGKIGKTYRSIKHVVDFAPWDNTQLVVATSDLGIQLFNTETGRTTILIQPHEIPFVTCIFLEADNLWIGTLKGIRHFDRKRATLLSDVYTETKTYVKSISRDTHGNMWVGTWGDGLFKFERNAGMKHYDVTSGLPNNVAYGIVEDFGGNFWVSTNLGISRFNPRKMEFINYDLQDGLQGNEFNTGAHYKSINGTLYFGGITGLSYFNPEEVLRSQLPPKVQATGLIVNNRPFDHWQSKTVQNVQLISKLEIKKNENDVTLEFTAIDFKRPDKNIYEIAISDSTWRTLKSQHNIELVNLHSGLHQIKVRAKKPGSEWSSSNTLMSIYVIPSIWERAWFRTAVAAAFLILMFMIYRYREHRLLEANATLNKLVSERTHEIQKKNEEIASHNTIVRKQNDELKLQSSLVEEKNLLLNEQRQQLLRLSSDLEQKVEERTHDIQQLNKDLLDQNLQLEQFSFMIAHNFRGPVARLKGLFNILPPRITEDSSTREIFSYLTTTIDDMEEVIQDVNNILAIKRQAKEYNENVDLREVLQKTILLLAEEVTSRNAVIDTEDFLPLHVRGSKGYTQSIFFNLLHNALKFSKKDEACQIKVSSFVDDQYVTLEVVDNGIGIDLQVAWNKIFRLYQRFTYGAEGRGFGLFLVKTQVEQLNGQISVESSLGVGSKFTVRFPVEYNIPQTAETGESENFTDYSKG